MNVIIDRATCVSCGSCWETCPGLFEQDPDDSFSRIIEKYRVDDDNAVGKPPAESGECSAKAADSAVPKSSILKRIEAAVCNFTPTGCEVPLACRLPVPVVNRIFLTCRAVPVPVISREAAQ